MVNAALELPEPHQITSHADFASIGLWATQQRHELARLAKRLQSLQASLEPSTDSRSPLDGPEVEPTATTPVALIDGMLAAAMARLDAGAEAARDDAQGRLAKARWEATELLISAGADSDTVRRVTCPSPETLPLLRRPRRAIVLRQVLQGSGSSQGAPVPQACQSTPAGDGPEDPDDSGSITLPNPLVEAVAVDAVGLVAGNTSQAYDLFWEIASSDRPVRERLRRFGQRSQG